MLFRSLWVRARRAMTPKQVELVEALLHSFAANLGPNIAAALGQFDPERSRLAESVLVENHVRRTVTPRTKSPSK